MDLYTLINNCYNSEFANSNLPFVKQVVILYDCGYWPVKVR